MCYHYALSKPLSTEVGWKYCSLKGNRGNFCLWKPESGKHLHVESKILGFAILNTAQGIWNPTNDWNPESKFH